MKFIEFMRSRTTAEKLITENNVLGKRLFRFKLELVLSVHAALIAVVCNTCFPLEKLGAR